MTLGDQLRTIVSIVEVDLLARLIQAAQYVLGCPIPYRICCLVITEIRSHPKVQGRYEHNAETCTYVEECPVR
jgi:hypothetical protein